MSLKITTMAGFLISCLLTFSLMESSWAWISTPARGAMPWSSLSRSVNAKSQALFSSSSSSEGERRAQRAAIEGVSLAPQGFWAMLRVAPDGYLPWQVTDDPQDAHAATSAEALTLIQLLSGVDMAGAILPPDVLARLVVLQCEHLVHTSTSIQEIDLAMEILSFVQESLPNATAAYSEVHPWVQSRVKLPTASLDEVLINPQDDSFTLTCSVRNFGSLTFCPTNDMLETVLYQFSPSTSLAFTSLALALRYQAPVSVLLPNQDQGFPLEAIQQKFPMYATVSSLQKSSNRVQENIVRGFEIHKLQGALRIAMERGDAAAAAKIRQALDEYDSMDQLPTAEFEQAEGGLQRNCTMGNVMQ